MSCRKCGSSNVNVQVVSETKLKNKHHGLLWWLVIGWWWVFFKWTFLTIPALLAKIFIPKKQRAHTIYKSVCVCQNCGNRWAV